MIFNEELEKWIDETKRADDDNIDTEGLQELISSYRALSIAEKNAAVGLVSFKLPDDFFLRISARILGKYDDCNCGLTLEFLKPMEKETKLTNAHHRTDFDMEQAIGYLGGNRLNVYEAEDRKGSIDAALMSYYRLPSYIDLGGYINDDGKESEDKDTELSSLIMYEIIDRSAREFYLRNTDQTRLAMSRKN